MAKLQKGVDASDIAYGYDWELGDTKPKIVASDSKGSPGYHDPVVCGDDSAEDWTKYKATLTAAKSGKAAFVSAFTTAWGSTAAAGIASWSSAKQDVLVDLAAFWAGKLGL